MPDPTENTPNYYDRDNERFNLIHPNDWENDSGPIGWFGITDSMQGDQGGIVAYAATQHLAEIMVVALRGSDVAPLGDCHPLAREKEEVSDEPLPLDDEDLELLGKH
jgi:hypothetical protein